VQLVVVVAAAAVVVLQGGGGVVGCGIPRKENSPIFLCFWRPPPLPVSPGSPEIDPMMDQNRRSGKKNWVD